MQKNNDRMDLKIELIDSISSIKDSWYELTENNPNSTVFQTYELNEVWLSTYKTSKCSILIALNDNNIVGIAPLVLTKIQEFGLSYNKINFIGFNTFDYLDFIIKDNFECCINAFVNYLNNYKNWHILELDNLQLNSYVIKNISIKNHIYKKSVCPFFYIDKNYSNFLKNITRGLRYDLKKGLSDLSSLGEYEFIIFNNNKLNEEEFLNFFKLLKLRESSTNRIGSIESDLLRKDFYKNLFYSNFAQYIHFSTIKINNMSIAYHLGFAFKNIIYWYKPTFNLDYSKYSPGKLLINEVLKYETGNNYEKFDFLMGNETYKYQWTNLDNQIISIRLHNKLLYSKLLYAWFNDFRPKIKYIYNTIFIYFQKN